MRDEVYLGDGLYASFDGFMITLRAPRSNGDHWVGLEPDALKAFDEFRKGIAARSEKVLSTQLQEDDEEERGGSA